VSAHDQDNPSLVDAPLDDETRLERIAALEAQNDALEAQVEDLIATEQRLFRSQHELDRQLCRINAINQFALDAAMAFEPRQILEHALSTLLNVLNLDQGIGLLAVNEGGLEVACVKSKAGLEATGVADQRDAEFPCSLAPEAVRVRPRATILEPEPDWNERPGSDEALQRILETFDQAFPVPVSEHHDVFVYLPLLGLRGGELMAVLLAREVGSSSRFEYAREDTDRPFLELLRGHLEGSLEAAVLHERVSNFAVVLEQRVEQRTHDLVQLNRELEESLTELRETQGQLFQAGKMAAIGTLVAGISHELNTPLSIIMGYAQTLLKTADASHELREVFKVIERQARRCSDLVESLLDLSRHGSDTRTHISAEGILNHVAEIARTATRGTSVELIVCTPEEGLPMLKVNGTELQSALLNIVNNAIDATAPLGTVTLEACAATVGEENGVQFVVTDTGTGVPEELQSFVFDPFFTTKPVGEGTGLGLAITRRIVEAHSGQIELQSSPNGTTISIWIPLEYPDL